MPLDLAQARLAVPLLERFFFSRSDTVAIAEKGGNPQPAGGSLRALLSTHVAGTKAPAAVVSLQAKGTILGASIGHFRVGSYCLNAESKVRWLCLDFDAGGDHANALADPTGTALAAHAGFVERGIPAYLERSGGGHGWHLWVFFADLVPAAKARRLAFALVPSDAVLADGGPADPQAGRGIEVFPKQDRITKGGFGNLVWLPWWCGAAAGGNTFVRLETGDGRLEEYFPETFETLAEEQLDALLATFDAEAAARRPTAPATTVATDPTIDLATFEFPPDEGSASPDWRAWRAKAVAALALESIYGQWLTGERTGPGWLQCRDPWSPSGDQNPSAGVADGTGEAERGTFHSFRSGQSMSVFDFLVRSGKASNFGDALKQVASLVGVAMPQRRVLPTTTATAIPSAPGSPAPAAAPAPRYPEIVTNGRQTRDIVRDTWNALIARNSMGQPFLFQRGGQIVRLRRFERSGQLVIEPLDDIAMFSVLIHNMNWVKVTQEAKIAAAPGMDIARMLLSSPDPRLPSLSSMLTTPAFGSSGQLIRTNGYHASDGVWYDGVDRLDYTDVPEAPTADQIAAARSLLVDDLAVDFPFATPSDRAHFLGALLLPFVRRLIPTATPLHTFEAPAVGSGKSLLCAAIAAITSGHDLPTSSVPDQDEEFRKVITSKLLAGSPIILLDNVREKRLFDSPILAAALTSTTWVDRVLGSNKVVALPNLASWFLTGNNPRLSMELLRRCVRIRLNPRCQRAWQRGDFKHDPLLGWVRENRRELVKACLTLIQAWVRAGSPSGGRRLGSFEAWAYTMGGILDVAGIPGFLGNLDDIYETADNESQEWGAFVSEWWDRFGSSPRKVSELLALCEERELMVEARGTGNEKSQQVRLGKALAATRDQIFGAFCIDAEYDAKAKARSYRLRRADDPGPGPARKAAPDLDLFGEPTAPSGTSAPGNAKDFGADFPPPEEGSPALAGYHGITRQYPATNFASVSPTKSEAPQDPAGCAGKAGYLTPRVYAHERAQDAHAHAHTHVETQENIPPYPPSCLNSFEINGPDIGMSYPATRLYPETSRRDGLTAQHDPEPLPDLADFGPWDDGDDGNHGEDEADPHGPWQDPPT